MDHETNKQEPSSTEGRQVKVGDKVWVLCEVAMVYRDRAALYMDMRHDGAVFEAKLSDCRPVEPVNSPKILDSSSEPMRDAFEADLIQRHGWNQSYFGRNENRYFDSSVEIAWQAFQAGAKNQSSQFDNPETVKQFVIVTDNDGNQTLYIDGLLRDGDNTVYGCDVADASNGCAIKIELRDVDFIVEHWPLRFSDLSAEAKQPESSPLAPSPCLDGVNVDLFVEGIMEARGRTSEPLQVGDAVRFVSPGHERHGTKGVVTSEVDLVSSGCNYWFESNCGKFSCYCTASQLERINKSDPVNPGHYKHLPAEAIDIIEAAIAKAPSNQYAFLQGQVIKYLLRCWSKKGIEDLRKAKWYLDRLVNGFDDLLAEASGANDGPVFKRYREPTLADLASGPIACESRDHESQDWKSRMLTDVLSGTSHRFLCLNAGAKNALRYAQCRIEVGE
jgi:hypothetical protein